MLAKRYWFSVTNSVMSKDDVYRYSRVCNLCKSLLLLILLDGCETWSLLDHTERIRAFEKKSEDPAPDLV